ncbi:MAG: MBL fold metallo-hydrolase [Deltaproteobacteria bacterium]|nr:MBL fold metallo-hydrolase [Deltaproteobacteria bacterium]
MQLDNITILFDVYYSDDILKNSKKGNIDLSDIDYLILSHGHIDHTEGLKFMNLSDIKNILAHPDCFQKRFFEEGEYIGMPIELEDLKKSTNVILSKEWYWILKDKIVFLGEIPRENDFEGKNPVGYLENGNKDYVMDDSAIVVKSEKGLIVISGCSHSGICNIIEHAKKVTGMEQVEAVIGGFHLGAIDRQTKKTIQYMNDHKIPGLFPSHCTRDPALRMFKEVLGSREVVVGVERIWK